MAVYTEYTDHAMLRIHYFRQHTLSHLQPTNLIPLARIEPISRWNPPHRQEHTIKLCYVTFAVTNYNTVNRTSHATQKFIRLSTETVEFALITLNDRSKPVLLHIPSATPLLASHHLGGHKVWLRTSSTARLESCPSENSPDKAPELRSWRSNVVLVPLPSLLALPGVQGARADGDISVLALLRNSSSSPTRRLVGSGVSIRLALGACTGVTLRKLLLLLRWDGWESVLNSSGRVTNSQGHALPHESLLLEDCFIPVGSKMNS